MKRLNSEKLIGFLIEGDNVNTVISMPKDGEVITIDQSNEDGDTQTVSIHFDNLLEVMLKIDDEMIGDLDEDY